MNACATPPITTRSTGLVCSASRARMARTARTSLVRRCTRSTYTWAPGAPPMTRSTCGGAPTLPSAAPPLARPPAPSRRADAGGAAWGRAMLRARLVCTAPSASSATPLPLNPTTAPRAAATVAVASWCIWAPLGALLPTPRTWRTANRARNQASWSAQRPSACKSQRGCWAHCFCCSACARACPTTRAPPSAGSGRQRSLRTK